MVKKLQEGIALNKKFCYIVVFVKLPILICATGVVLIIGGIFTSGLIPKPNTRLNSQEKSTYSSKIKVDVSGAVEKPSVYSLNAGSRIEDAMIVAGGFHPSANKQYISKSLNLSQKLSDGQKIYIPFERETFDYAQGGAVAGKEFKVNLNSATQKQLEDLPGIGAATALKIMSLRPYATAGELLSKKVVTKAVFEKIKDLVDVN